LPGGEAGEEWKTDADGNAGRDCERQRTGLNAEEVGLEVDRRPQADRLAR
jgi:hypothetical protein